MVIALILSIPALFLNLGMMPFTSDEPTRGIVAMEMLFSGNYITPTLKGEFYYNKPPLYNYLIAASFSISQRSPELMLRLPAVIALIGFIIYIKNFVQRYFDQKTGWMVALAFLTCGRILFWDSMLGLIDILFSWLTFISFAVIIRGVQEKKFLKLFLLAYLITAAGVLMKGLPSIAFLGITLLTVFIAEKQFKQLFSWKHAGGALLFLIIIGSYFYAYSHYNNIESFFATLWGQSTTRASGFSIEKVLLHLGLFHFEMIYHFFPWSLMALLLFSKRAVEIIKKNSIVKLMVILFLANILIYWISPGTVPRYVIMLIPVSFIILAYLREQRTALPVWTVKPVEIILCYLIPVLIPITLLAQMFVPDLQHIPYLIPLAVISGIITVILTIVVFKTKRNRLLIIVVMLLLFRINFNLTYLPVRVSNMWEQELKIKAERVAAITEGEDLKIFKGSVLDHCTTLYLELARQETITFEKEQPQQGVYYLADHVLLKKSGVSIQEDIDVHFQLFVKHENRPLYLFTIKE
ncbi:MAG: hypothetical protein RQ866_03570 [Bacteroidales bacterium]|nr:hypothetical protein [Bacteroidales bacterium]